MPMNVYEKFTIILTIDTQDFYPYSKINEISYMYQGDCFSRLLERLKYRWG
jgi:hypothetical protein